MTECRSRGEPGGAKAQRPKLQCRLRYLLAARISPRRSHPEIPVAGHFKAQARCLILGLLQLYMVRDHLFVQLISRACWYEDLRCLISLKIKRRLSRPARERS